MKNKCIINLYSSRVCGEGTLCCEVYHNEIIDFCPFCLVGDFDKIGLKTHLINGECEEFNNTEVLNRIF